MKELGFLWKASRKMINRQKPKVRFGSLQGATLGQDDFLPCAVWFFSLDIWHRGIYLVPSKRNHCRWSGDWRHMSNFGSDYSLLEPGSFFFAKSDFFQTQNDLGKNRQNPVISVFSHCVILFVSTLCLVHVLIIFTSNKDQVFNLVKVIWSFLSFSYISS